MKTKSIWLSNNLTHTVHPGSIIGFSRDTLMTRCLWWWFTTHIGDITRGWAEDMSLCIQHSSLKLQRSAFNCCTCWIINVFLEVVKGIVIFLRSCPVWCWFPCTVIVWRRSGKEDNSSTHSTDNWVVTVKIITLKRDLGWSENEWPEAGESGHVTVTQQPNGQTGEMPDELGRSLEWKALVDMSGPHNGRFWKNDRWRQREGCW